MFLRRSGTGRELPVVCSVINGIRGCFIIKFLIYCIHKFNLKGGITMPISKKPNIEDWKQLYEAAIEFKKAKCWEWMYENDIFGVKDPKSGEIGYCCIMGNAGEHFAITAYLGNKGLDGYLTLISDTNDIENPDNMFIQNCLMCSFEDRSQLASEDLKVIKKLGLKFRGSNEWPVFRHFEPGFFPWFLNADQAYFLTNVLRQALQVSMRCRFNKFILAHETPATFLVRVFAADKTEKPVWEDQHVTAHFPEQEFISIQITDELWLKKLKSLKTKRGRSLEVDTFFAPVPVRESQERPYYPKACVLLDHNNGMIVSVEMFQDTKKEGYKCVDLLITYINNSGHFPSRLLVSREETYNLFSGVCNQLGIEIVVKERLELMEEARSEMFSFFQNR